MATHSIPFEGEFTRRNKRKSGVRVMVLSCVSCQR